MELGFHVLSQGPHFRLQWFNFDIIDATSEVCVRLCNSTGNSNTYNRITTAYPCYMTRVHIQLHAVRLTGLSLLRNVLIIYKNQ